MSKMRVLVVYSLICILFRFFYMLFARSIPSAGVLKEKRRAGGTFRPA